MSQPFDDYFRQLQTAYSQGNATEHTYRAALSRLLEALEPGVLATNEPKREACGAPDYIVTRGQTPLGYLEAKDIGEPLGKLEDSAQLKRYRESLSNLILTDYLEFRWFVNGEHRLTARLASQAPGRKLKLEPDGEKKVRDLLDHFFQSTTPTIRTPKELARRLAALARFIREGTQAALTEEGENGPLHSQLKSFREVLLPALTRDEFADMYAQTICYGMFAARVEAPAGAYFSRETAYKYIPKANSFLQKTFYYITGPELDDERVTWAVNDLAALLNRADLAAILHDFGKRTRQEDPVVHFYETFLAAYDPKMREARGVYYTPEPVVSYIVRSVDLLLKRDFDIADGLADTTRLEVKSKAGQTLSTHRVQVLDPATGTGTFLHGIIDHVYETVATRDRGGWPDYVSSHLLPRLFGFELLMAPYTVAHLKLELQLKETGFKFGDKDQVKVFLTNTLSEGDEIGRSLFASHLKDEANAASHVKYDYPVMVVLGNPPYSNFGMMNKNPWIIDLIADYKKDLNEKKINLDDDFIKFMRFAQWRIDRTGSGILAFISNNTYIDGITHRRMRQSLMETFDDIYILDLHGSIKKQEKAPDGSKDENVFDIQQGVAIGIFVKKPEHAPVKRVFHSELWGLREKKYQQLFDSDILNIGWKELTPKSDQFFFVPKDFSLGEEYNTYLSLSEKVFISSNAGIQTKNDSFVYSFTEQDLEQRIIDLKKESISYLSSKYNLSTEGNWSISEAKQDIKQNPGKNTIIQYRPFDKRWTYYTGKSSGFMARPRSPLMESALFPNLILLTIRNSRRGNIDNFFIANTIVDKDAVSPFDNATVFPLYLYPEKNKAKTLWDMGDEAGPGEGGRRPNLAGEFTGEVAAKLEMRFVPDGRGDLQTTFGPEDLFHYMYAVFHAPTYRSRYAEFLKIDFPRLPLTGQPDLFRELCRLGRELTGLHLLESHPPRLTHFPLAGTNLVETVRYTPPGQPEAAQAGAGQPGASDPGRVWINPQQYFEGVPPEVWEFQVGGYQVLQKWLKDRKGRALSYDDIQHYHSIVAVLSETIRLMADIDGIIEDAGGWPLK